MDQNTKKQIVQKLKDDLRDIESIFLCNFTGLTVEKDTVLRKKMRESGSTYLVTKNTLLKIAFKDSTFSQVDESLVGNTALVHNKDDVVGVAKLIRDFAKDNEAFQFKAGVIEGTVIDVDGLDALAEMPSKEELVSKLMYMMNYPVQGFATALSGVSRKLVIALDQIRQQKENN